MGRRPKWRYTLEASRREALLAVDLYNRIAAERSLEAFVVHMHLAWLHLLHARFDRDGVDYRCRASKNRFERIDGRIKVWDLARCVREQYPEPHHPVRVNLEFFIRIRNQIEHQYERDLALTITGRCQALVVNYEESLVEHFGQEEGIAEDLRLPIFLTSLTQDAVAAVAHATARLPSTTTRFLAKFEADLPDATVNDLRYDFRVFLFGQKGPKSAADVAMRFFRDEELTDRQRKLLGQFQTIVRDKSVPVQNLGHLRPGQVVAAVAERLPWVFNMHAHTQCWKTLGVRPPSDADNPGKTDPLYCVYDEPHEDYLYTDEWVLRVVSELADPGRFKEIVGQAPVA